MKWFYQTRTLSFLAMLFFVVTGTYNAVVINSESHLSVTDMRFVKRLDELNGVIEPGRLVATGVQWQKLETVPEKLPTAEVVQRVATIMSSPANSSETQTQEPTTAAVTEELSLNLVEVINPKKWQNGLAGDQFSGNLTTSNGAIDSLNVSLPNGEGVTVSFSEMNGNVFEYDIDGEVYTGMLYQVEQSAYMVTLTNGPLEGTRLRFTGEPSQDQLAAAQNELISNNSADNFGNPGESGEQVQAEESPGPQPAPEMMVNLVPAQAPEPEPNIQAMAPQDQDALYQQQAIEDIPQENNG